MRKSFTETQIVAILNAYDAGARTAELARKYGIHTSTLRQWRSKYRGTGARDVAKVRALTEATEAEAGVAKLRALTDEEAEAGDVASGGQLGTKPVMSPAT